MSNNEGQNSAGEAADLEIGERLAAARLLSRLTQTEIAHTLGVSRQHISNIETGIRSPTLHLLRDYLRACGTDLAEFFYGPLPTKQTHRQRRYHRDLQTLLDDETMEPVISKIVDSFMTSLVSSRTAMVQPAHVRARRARSEALKGKGRIIQ